MDDVPVLVGCRGGFCGGGYGLDVDVFHRLGLGMFHWLDLGVLYRLDFGVLHRLDLGGLYRLGLGVLYRLGLLDRLGVFHWLGMDFVRRFGGSLGFGPFGGEDFFWHVRS